MTKTQDIYCYRSGPIERDPSASFHAKNRLDAAFREMDIKIIGDTFEILNARGKPQSIYGPGLRKLRNKGLFEAYCYHERLLIESLRAVRRATFVVVRPSPEASGGTTSEVVVTWLKNIPKLVIIGPHCEGVIDNNSTFMIRMLTDGCSLLFNTEKEVEDFVRKHLETFQKGRQAVRDLILEIKRPDAFINSRPKLLYDDCFEGRTVIIQGRPGCGKDTQGRLLQDLCGFKFFGSGHELRHLHAGFPSLRKSLGEGNLAPPWVIINRITQKLIGLEKFEPIVFSGTPKKMIEAEMLFSALNDLGRKPLVVVIEIDEELARERIKLRRNCDNCEVSFCGWEFVLDPACPRCGASFTSRPENSNDEAIDKIMGWYETDVEAVIDFFAQKTPIYYIDGHRSKEEIFQDFLDILKKETT